MTNLEKAARQALEALEEYQAGNRTEFFGAITALREALAEQAEQEPVAEIVLRNQTVGFGRTEERKDIVFLADVDVGTKLYAAPVRTKDLTDDEIDLIDALNWEKDNKVWGIREFARAVIAADREKNK